MQQLASDLAALDRVCCLAGLTEHSVSMSACQQVILAGLDVECRDDNVLMYLHSLTVEAMMDPDRHEPVRSTLNDLEVWCLEQLQILQ